MGELINIFNQKRVPLSTKVRNTRKGIYPYYGASNIVDYIDDYIFDGEYLLISEDGENLNTRNTPIAFIAKGKFWVNNHAHIVKGIETHLTKYLELYFLKLDISAYITGAVQPKLSKGNLINIPILISKSKDEQKAIANILTAFDDKIENLQAQNKTLEQTAQTIFKEWFGKYQVGDELPEGWRYGKLSDFGRIVTGKTPNKSKPEYWGYNIPFITPTDFKNFGLYSGITQRYLSDLGWKKMKSNQILKKSIMVTCIGSDMGKVCINSKDSVTNQQINSIIIENKEQLGYVYEFLKNQYQNLRSIALGGSTMPIINKSDFSNISIPIPTDIIISKYQVIWKSISLKILTNSEQIQNLKKTRDALLPKLMSGQLRVNEFKA